MTVPGKRRRRQRRPTLAERDAFLVALADGWSVKSAAEKAGADRHRFYELRSDDEAFAEQWTEAYESATQMLEDELRRRSVEGWDEDTFDGDGKLLRRVRRMLPHDLHLQLKARRPETYRDSARVEVRNALFAGTPDVALQNAAPEDVAAALDRFVAQVARLTERRRALDAGVFDVGVVEGDWRPVPTVPGTGGRGQEVDPPAWATDPYGANGNGGST